MDPIEQFAQERDQRIRAQGNNEQLQSAARTFRQESIGSQYSYNFSWMGRPIIQYPQDLMALQEIVWTIQPDLVIETGIAHGGSLIFYASLLELIGKGEVLGLDVEIRPHNRKAVETHPMAGRIAMLEGDSTAADIAKQVAERAKGKECVLVCLDSNHTHEHVLQEMELYGPLVTPGSYMVVLDTVIEDLPDDFYDNRPWSRGNNPRTAVRQYLESNDHFTVDQSVDDKLLISVAPGGYIKRVK